MSVVGAKPAFTVAVTGATGFLGRHVVRALCKQGWRVRVATRRPHLAGDVKLAGDVGQVQLVQANVRNRPSIKRAIENADAVVNLVGILAENGSQSFQGTQALGAANIAELAAEAGLVIAAATGTGENDTRASFSNLHPLGHFGVPQNIADAVAVFVALIGVGSRWATVADVAHAVLVEVHGVRGQRRDFQERGARVQQHLHPVARQQLATGGVLGTCRIPPSQRGLRHLQIEVVDQRLHGPGIGLEVC